MLALSSWLAGSVLMLGLPALLAEQSSERTEIFPGRAAQDGGLSWVGQGLPPSTESRIPLFHFLAGQLQARR